jgi:hypothetical protein
MPFMRPHMEAYFERVGQIMGIQPEELRLPATRKPRPVASRKRVTGKKVTGKKQKDKEKQPALMSTDDKLHAEFLAAIDQAEAETAAEEAEAAAASGQLGEDEEQYEEDFESSEDEEDEGGVGVITIEPSTVAARQATRARPKATAGIYMLPSRGTAVGSLRRPARGAAPVDIASIPTYERDVEWQRRNDEKVPSSRQKDSTAAKLRVRATSSLRYPNCLCVIPPFLVASPDQLQIVPPFARMVKLQEFGVATATVRYSHRLVRRRDIFQHQAQLLHGAHPRCVINPDGEGGCVGNTNISNSRLRRSRGRARRRSHSIASGSSSRGWRRRRSARDGLRDWRTRRRRKASSAARARAQRDSKPAGTKKA